MAEPITVERLHLDHSGVLKMHLIAGARGLKRVIREPTVNRPGLALAGFRRYFAPKRIQVIGNVETSYLRSLPAGVRRQRYKELLSYRIPCLVFCRDIEPDKAFLKAAEEAGVPIFRSELITMKFINLATLTLEHMFAPRGQVHGTMVDVQGVGVIIQGESGIGKSEAALGLLERGYSLVSDDVTLLRIDDNAELIGSGKELGRNFMEVRGIGLINVAAMFGIAAIRREKRVDFIVELKKWEEGMEIDRLGLEEPTKKLLEIPIPLVTLPVRPGRDLARLTEVASLHTKLKLSGYNAASEFTERLAAHMNVGKGL